MIYPKFLNKESVIGITAPSSGVGHKLEAYLKSIKTLKKEFNIYETKSVKNDGYVSASGQVRGKEFNELLLNDDVELILCASGGDFCISALEYIDFDLISKNVKWVEGYSDPTSILFYITTKYDIATIYGNNSTSFDQMNLHSSLKYNLELLKGNIKRQDKYSYYEKDRRDELDGYNLTEVVKYNNINGDVSLTGRIIGGCLDVLVNIIGTRYDYINDFIERYKLDGIIWYFDIFNISVEDLYNKLYQFKYAGYFKYTKCIIVGRILFKSGYTSYTYESVLKEVLPDIKIISDFDIGHIAPKMTIINGSIANVVSNDSVAYIEMFLK